MKLKTIVLFLFCVIFFFKKSHGQDENLKANWESLMVGKWKSDVSKTMDGSEYFGFKCKGTIEYLSNGEYNSQQCDWDETGEWKFSENKDFMETKSFENCHFTGKT